MHEKILIIEDDEGMQFFLSEALKKQDYQVVSFSDAESALVWLDKEKCNLVLLDIRLPGIDGIDAIDPIQEKSDACIIIITAFGEKRLALEAIRKGAYDYFTKPFKLEEMEITVKRALEKHKLKKELLFTKRNIEKTFQFPNIIGQEDSIKKVLNQVNMVSNTDTTVLIIGETGTGKELIAQAIHENSPRRDKPFIKLNCVAIPEGLIESELFGHEKGAFTGAINRKIGKFELADKGTIFLDEIGDMTLSTQIKLLRILQEKEFERVGGTLPIKVDVRIIAATNKDLFTEVKEKRFRDDLFYRLNVVMIFLPPLRERKKDIPLLIEHFLEKISKVFRKKIDKISKEVMDILTEYKWPGNIRELENTIERAVVMLTESEEIIKISHLPLYLRGLSQGASYKPSKITTSLDESVAQFEKEIILEALYNAKGIQSYAAKELGITERSLWHRIKKYGININRIKKLQKM